MPSSIGKSPDPGGSAPLRILLIEDSAIDVELAQYELTQYGLRTDCASVSTEHKMRQALSEFRPDVILSDHSMPAFDGLSALRIAKELAPDVPFVFLSGTIGEERAIEALKCGATDYVLKTNLERLGPAVERAVREANNKLARRDAELARMRLAEILEATPDFVGIYDESHAFTYVNAGGRRLLKLAEDTPYPVHSAFAPASRDVVESGTAQARTTGEWHGETALVDAHGEEIPVSLVILAHGAAEGCIAYFSMIARDMRERKQYEAHVAYLANFDQLTGLPNRDSLHDRTAQAIAYARRNHLEIALVLLTIDQINTITAGYGTKASDDTLVEIAKRLNALSRPGDTVARLGTGSFALLVTDIAGEEDALNRASEVSRTLKAVMRVGTSEIRVSASIGISIFPKDGDDLERLVANAEAAVRRAKADGHGNMRFYALGMERKALERLDLEVALERAMETAELAVHYQPQFDIRTRAITGAEALLRWTRKDVGSIGPAVFVPIAEESGLIIPLGQWILNSVCIEAAQWPVHPAFRVAVNVSARQLYSGICNTVRDALRVSGLPPDRLEIELTEGVALRDTDAAVDVLRELKSIGVAISIDDFGTGQCGLSYLSTLPVDRLKIDRSFIVKMAQDRTHRAIVRTIISMAEILDLGVIAEGVETEEQCGALIEDGCYDAQGFVFSRAVPTPELLAMYEANRGRRP